jgi:NADH-quinone oxidoreductase subunit F
MARIVSAVAEGQVLEDLLYKDPVTRKVIEKQDEIPFFKKQVRTLMGRHERIDPIRIYNYIAAGGYAPLMKVLAKRSPAWVVEEVTKSGLRGRGGAGFPTGCKWDLLARQPAGRGKVLVCNADEGDPGAYMDRSVLEGNPHSVIEGMLIGAYGVGATEGVIYVRNEYPLAIKHLIIALRQAREMGMLGENIFDSGFSFDLEIVRGAGAFVCGEETALMRSIEGKMGEPRQRPPFPVQRGINGKPTAINNVETWANIPVIFEMGAAQYRKTGSPVSPGTKIFSLVGKVRNSGLVEVPMGSTLRDVVEGIGGGSSGKAGVKAVQTGGPSGGCIPAKLFDLPIDYESLAGAGSIMGSGGMIVMDENTCMVDVARYFVQFLEDESCGKCFTCRKGIQRMRELLEDISSGRGSPEHLSLLEELALVVRDTSMCGLGQSASNPVLSVLRSFREECMRHVEEKRCDAFVCADLVGAPCQAACPLGTEAWRYVALLEKGDFEDAYRVIRQTNPLPSVCARVCDRRCESRCRLGTSGSAPLELRALKRVVTDAADPALYEPPREPAPKDVPPEVAIIGAGPAGLAAAHQLSLAGIASTLLDARARPGGMLLSAIPAFRLPRDVLNRDIDALLDANIHFRCETVLGRDLDIDDLFAEGHRAVFVATGAHRCRRLALEDEDAEGVLPSIKFLSAQNLDGRELAKGHVGIVGGGNSAVDAARVAIRQQDVDKVTIYYRRTRQEMPAYEEELAAALDEGVSVQTLVTPVRLRLDEGHIAGVRFIRNELGNSDESGRGRPVPVAGSEFDVALDTLIVAIGEQPDAGPLASSGLELNRDGTVRVDPSTQATTRAGVFAGGDLATGPNTVVDAIAAGKRAAAAIVAFLRGAPLRRQTRLGIPSVHVAPPATRPLESAAAEPRLLAVASRTRNFLEVEQTLRAKEAEREARRCLRCDLAFTEPSRETGPLTRSGGRM